MSRPLISDADQLAAMRQQLVEYRDDPIYGHRMDTEGWHWLNRIIAGYPSPRTDRTRAEDHELWLDEARARERSRA